MADTTITINGTLRLDQTAGVQDNDFALSSTLAELTDRFEFFLNRTAVAPAPIMPANLALDAAQRTFAATAEAAKSAAGYVTVTPAANSTISDLFFSDPDGSPELRALDAEVIGEELDDRATSTVTGTSRLLWPSDHAGVVATLSVGRPT